MVTATSPIARQPDKLDYASPTQFKFGIHQLPLVEFFTVSANIPSVSVGVATIETPFKDIPLMGDKMEFDNLTITFIVDEYLENYITLHNWIRGIGFPTERKEFRSFRDVTSNTPAGGKTPSVHLVGAAVSDKAMYSDAYLMVLSNKNNPIIEIDFQNLFPVSLGALEFTQTATDVEYMTVDAEFAYEIYDIKTL